MAFRQAARDSEKFSIDWGDFRVVTWTEDRTDDIAKFLYGTGSQAFAEVEDCSDGTPESARYYVTRARKYMLAKPKEEADLGYEASSLVYDNATDTLAGVCLCCGPSVYLIEVHPDYQRQHLATRMLQRALTVCAEHHVPSFHLWRNDDTLEAGFYEKMGFELTGEVE